jgi:hypothetical protein
MILNTVNLDCSLVLKHLKFLYKWQIGLKEEKPKYFKFEFQSNLN